VLRVRVCACVCVCACDTNTHTYIAAIPAHPGEWDESQQLQAWDICWKHLLDRRKERTTREFKAAKHVGVLRNVSAEMFAPQRSLEEGGFLQRGLSNNKFTNLEGKPKNTTL
jgi:hypothetical protein